VGQRVAADRFSLWDDGLHPNGMATSPFDDEGVPRRKTTLVGDGFLRGYLHDTYTAAKEGGEIRSTGNASRGSYRGSPGVSPSNLVVSSGEGDLADLLRRVGTGLYVVDITGLHSGANAVSGEFSVGAVGLLIDGGALAAPVREVTIASDLLSLLRNVSDLGADSRWIPVGGSVLTPSVAIGDITVAGT
jgi:PmbA protein